MADIATLGIAVDSRDAKTAATDLDKLTQAGTRTETSMTKVAAASKKAAADVHSIGNSAKQTAFAMRQLPMQMTDIAVGLSTGQSPFYVLLQQGGQLKDTFGGIGPAARAVGGYIATLISPLTIAAAAAGALALAYKQGSDEQTAFAKSIITTGNISGVTTGQLADMASAIDDNVGTTHEAAAALAQLVSTGRIYGDQLQGLAQSAVAWEHATGTAVEDTVKQFAELAKDPVAASQKLNETMHYLTLSTYEQIKALKEQGREQDAAALALKTYDDAMNESRKKIEENLNAIGKAWRSVKDVASEIWDTMLGVGRENTIEEQIKKLTSLREFATPWKRVEIDADLEQLKTQKLIEEGNAAMWAEERRIQAEGIAAEERVAKVRDASLTNVEKREKALAALRLDFEKIRLANPNSAVLAPENRARLEQNVRDQFKDPEFKLDAYRQIQVEMDNMAAKAFDSSDVMREVARANKEYIDSIEKNIEAARSSVADTAEFLLSDEERLAESYARRQSMLDQAHEYGLISEERFLQLRNELSAKYDEDAAQMHAQKTSMMLQNSADLFDGMAGLAKTFSGEQSGIYKTMFAVSKAFAIADAIVKIQTGIANAAALPFPANLGAMATVAAATGSIVSTISSTKLQGIAHAGMDSIPREGTYLLDGGERIIKPEQNRDLTRFLGSSQKSAPPIVNLYEDKSRAGQVSNRQQDGRDVIDIFVADIMGDGRSQQAISRKFGIRGTGN